GPGPRHRLPRRARRRPAGGPARGGHRRGRRAPVALPTGRRPPRGPHTWPDHLTATRPAGPGNSVGRAFRQSYGGLVRRYAVTVAVRRFTCPRAVLGGDGAPRRRR